MAGFNIIPLAKRPKVSKLIVDADLDMGEYEIEAAAVNDVEITTHITVSPGPFEVHAYQYNTLPVIPPVKGVLFSGEIAYHANETNPNDVLMAVNAEGNGVELQRGFPTTEEIITFSNVQSVYMIVDTDVCYFKVPVYN